MATDYHIAITEFYQQRKTSKAEEKQNNQHSSSTKIIMNKFTLASLVMLLIVNAVSSCGGGSRGGSSRRTGWGWNNGVSYTFRNGVRVTGSGRLNPFEVSVGVNYRFKRDLDATTIPNNGTNKEGERISILLGA